MPLINANIPRNRANELIVSTGERKIIAPRTMEITPFKIRNTLFSELKALISVDIPIINIKILFIQS